MPAVLGSATLGKFCRMSPMYEPGFRRANWPSVRPFKKLPEGLWTAVRADPVGARPPVELVNHSTTNSPAMRNSRFPPRFCLRKGCDRQYVPAASNQRYCQDSNCLQEVHRWLALKRQQRRRERPAVRAAEAAVAKARRERRKQEKVAPDTKAYRLFRRNRLPPSARRCAEEKIPVKFVTVWAVTNRREHTATAVPPTAVTNVAIQCVAFEIENASISGDAHRLGASSVKRWQCGDGPHCRQRQRACQAIALNLSSHGLFASTPIDLPRNSM